MKPKHRLPLALALVVATAACLSKTARFTAGPEMVGGPNSYTWLEGWGDLPGGVTLGNTHGSILIDSEGRVLMNTDGAHAVIAYDPDGMPLFTWGEELRGGLHGMALVEEGGRELLYLVHTGRGEVIRATPEGEILWRRGWPEESGLYDDRNQYRPTAVAVGPDGTIFVADGYGKSYIHRFSADGTYLNSFGGGGEEDGKFRTCHGLAMDSSYDPPRLIVADRENHRLQAFDLEGNHLATYAGNLRRPCSVSCNAEGWLVADLAGRVTILSRDGELIAHLGDQPNERLRANNGVSSDLWRSGEFLAPHSAAWDASGNIYVVDWNRNGRVTKLSRN